MPIPGPDRETPFQGPALSIIVPVYREGAGINGLLEHLFGLEGGETAEVIVVDGDAGSTLRAIHLSNLSRIRSLVSPAGRGAQMNQGAEMAQAHRLLFFHADSRLPRGAIAKIIRALDSGDAVAGAFGLEIDTGNPWLRLIAKMATLRSRWTGIPYGDQALFFAREKFRETGGFPEWPLMEDVELMRRIKSRGWRIALLRDSVKVSPRRWEREGIIRGTLRNRVLMLLFLSGVPPRTLARWYPPP